MTQKRFTMDFSRAMFKHGDPPKWQNLTVRINAIGHFTNDGYFHHADIDSIEHDGCVFSPNLLWLANKDLYEEIEEALDQHGNEMAVEDAMELDLDTGND